MQTLGELIPPVVSALGTSNADGRVRRLSTDGELYEDASGGWRKLRAAGGGSALDGNNSLLLPAPTGDSTPASGIALQGRVEASRPAPSWVMPDGSLHALQESLGTGEIHLLLAVTSNIGFVWSGQSGGTASANNPSPTSTNAITSRLRTQLLTSATAGSYYQYRTTQNARWRGNAAGLGGFHGAFRFAGILAAGHWAAIGFASTGISSGNITSAAPAGILMCVEASDSTWQILSGNNSTVTKVNTGISSTSTNIFLFQIYCPPNATYIAVRIYNETTRAVVLDTQITATLPPAATFIGPVASVGNGSVASAAELDVFSYYSRA